MDDDEKAKDYAWMGSVFVVGAIAWAYLFGRAGEAVRTSPRSTVESAGVFPTVKAEPVGFSPDVAPKKTDWVQILATLVIIASLGACAAAVYWRIKSENQSAAITARPSLAVAVRSIDAIEGEVSAEVTVNDTGKVPAMNAELIASIVPAVADAEAFFRSGNTGKTELTPIPIGFVIPGKLQSYESPIVAPKPLQAAVSAKLAAGESVTVVGRVTYQDSEGHAYQTDFCFSRAPRGTIEPCAAHNTR